MGMIRLNTPLQGMFDAFVDAHMEPFTKAQATMQVRLGKVEGNLRRQVALNLDRGWCSSVSGPAYKLHLALAAKYQFPVFCLGRAQTMVVSCRISGAQQIRELRDKYEALWHVGRDENARGWRSQYFGFFTELGPAPGWMMLTMTKPKTVTIDGLLNTGGLGSLRDVVQREATEAARTALLRGDTIEFVLSSP